MKTAVEWLVEQQKELVVQIKNGEFVIEDYEYYNAMYIEQAKEMEKEQIMNAFDECGMWQDNYSDSEHYYNKTFKSE
jgi:hypothetical protein